MKTDDFNFYLPSELIAQSPLEKRDSSRLLILDKETGDIEHKHFSDIIDYLNPNDVLVLNDTKVMPARIIGTKEDTGAVIELLMLKEIEKDTWEVLSKPAKRIKVGTTIKFSDKLSAICTSIGEEGIRTFKFMYDGIFYEILDELGEMPLPPYIHEKLKDKDRYNTVYAKNYGSAAAPTAGLHFTNDLLDKIKEKGVEVLYVTLNVGLGTFRPVIENDITHHDMHSELYQISDDVALKLNKAKENNKRIICVGTTSLRTLEANINKYGKFKSTCEETDIFIYPPYKFKSADALITNFHLPKSTLVMLVSAFSSVDIIKNAYSHAQKEKYKFFSFGDAMFLTNEEETK